MKDGGAATDWGREGGRECLDWTVETVRLQILPAWRDKQGSVLRSILILLFSERQKYQIMRTPKHKRILQKAKSSATNRLRKRAMKNKVMKKTMLDIGGDDTREEVRDLMNESDLSLAGVVSRNISCFFHGKYFKVPTL